MIGNLPQVGVVGNSTVGLKVTVSYCSQFIFKADIESLKKIFPQRAAVGGVGAPTANNSPATDLASLYADAIKRGAIEEAMIYKRQMYEK